MMGKKQIDEDDTFRAAPLDLLVDDRIPIDLYPTEYETREV